MFYWVLNTPQDYAILSISEHQKCCKNDLAFYSGKICLKKTQLTLKQSYIFPVTLDNLEENSSAKLSSVSLKKNSLNQTMLPSYSYKCKYYENTKKRAWLSKCLSQ